MCDMFQCDIFKCHIFECHCHWWTLYFLDLTFSPFIKVHSLGSIESNRNSLHPAFCKDTQMLTLINLIQSWPRSVESSQSCEFVLNQSIVQCHTSITLRWILHIFLRCFWTTCFFIIFYSPLKRLK